MDSYGNSGFRGISLRRADVSSLFSNNIRSKMLSVTERAVVGHLLVDGSQLISSKNNITDGGFTIGGTVRKDMGNQNYTYEFDPVDRQSIFPDLPQIIDANIVAGDKSEEDRLIASYWSDLGNDVFDDWGYFYIFDVNSGTYYFPIISPRNQGDGVFNTQTFSAFGRTFTITHGWCVQGIFKFDISVNDNEPFRFGAYGNMGSDGDEDQYGLTDSYNLNGNSLTLYYHHHAESGSENEILYSYFIPKVVTENDTKTYDAFYDSDYMHMRSAEVTKGLIVYFAKKNDVKDWVINDLKISGTGDGNADVSGRLHVHGDILSAGFNMGKTTIITMDDEDYAPSVKNIMNGYFKNNDLSDNRLFTIPTASSIVAHIPDCSVGTTLHFKINNVQSGNYSRNLVTADGSVTIDSSCYNTVVYRNTIFSYAIVITSVTSGSESAVVLQEHNVYYD